MTRRLMLEIRDESCDLCKMCHGLNGRDICRLGYGDADADIMVVGKMPDSQQWREDLRTELADVGLDPSRLYFTSALKCRNFDANASNLDVKACRPYLEAEIAEVHPKWVLTFGNEALFSLTGHSGITKYRGRVIEKEGYSVFPTISPSAVKRNPGQRQAWVADLRLFVATVYEKNAKVPPPKVAIINTREKFDKLCRLLDRANLIAYDIETYAPNGKDEYDPDGAIVSLAGTCEVGGKLKVWALPLYHRSSPFRSSWRTALRRLAPHMESVPKQVAHNGKFDARWLRHAGNLHARVTFDTMLAAHLLDENRQKGLKPQAASRLGVAPWAISTNDLLKQPLSNILKYNALDTYYTYWIYKELRTELVGAPRLARIFTKLLMPANELLIQAEQHGVWVDRERLATNANVAKKMLAQIDQDLMKWVPPEPHDTKFCVLCKSGEHEMPPQWPIYKSGKLVPINFNPSIFSRWLLFEHLGLPILARGKEKPDGSEGDPSMAEAIMLELKGHHPIVAKLLERATWVKNAQFIKAYQEMADERDRIHTHFKLYGTVTGRLSSGKTEAEKISGRPNLRGINLQQVPRDTFIRGLFGATSPYIFVEVDFSQVELRVVAFLAREKTMLRLYQTGQDIHRATAAWVLGIPPSKIDKDQRKKAKAVNFGFAYGMGAPKFVHTAFEKYEVVFTLDEAKAIRQQFFTQFSGLQAWHARQRRLAHKYARVQSPIGRIRHLPDIRSSDFKVVGEAERQAINSPVQSFASDMNLMAMVEVDQVFKREAIKAHIIGTVHDATLFEIPRNQLKRALPIIKHTFEDRLVDILRTRYGVHLDVPIVADIKIGGWWGDARELTEQEIFSWDDASLS